VDDSPAHRWRTAYQRCPPANLRSRSRVILFFGTHQARQLAAAPVPEFFSSFSHLTFPTFHSNFDRQRCPIYKNFNIRLHFDYLLFFFFKKFIPHLSLISPDPVQQRVTTTKK
jgi:hypothetical protein